MRRWMTAAVIVAASVTVSAAGEAVKYMLNPDGSVDRIEPEPDIPEGAVAYESARFTQSIAITNEQDTIVPFPIRRMDDTRWHQPGGLEGVVGWKAEKYRTLPTGRVRHWIGNISVDNGIWTGRYKADGTRLNHHQRNRGILRQYPDGTRFDEVLRNTESGKVFEHRVREKHGSEWYSDIIYRNLKERPEGYKPVSVTECAGCHSEAGTGKYNNGLVPGGDGVLSDPLDWSVWYRGRYDPEAAR